MHRAVTLAAWLLVGLAGASVGRLALPNAGLRGHYYTNLARQGTPVAVTLDQSLSTDTLDNGTAGVWAAYAVTWTGFLVIDTADTYEFATTSDDGTELEVGNQLVVNNAGQHGPQEVRGTIALPVGVHPITLRYEQQGGGFSLSVRYARAGQRLAEIPAANLLPDAMPYAEYRVRRVIPLAGAVIAILLWVAAAHVLARRGPPTRHELGVPPRTLAIDRPGVAIAIIVAVGIVTRVLFTLGSDALLWGDSDVFLGTADAVRSGRLLEHDPFRTLLYPFFLAPFLAWSTEPPMDQVIVAAQHVLGVLTAVFCFMAGRPAFGTRAALAGALLLTVHTTQLFYEISILSEVFFGCVLAMSVVPMARFVSQPTVRGAVVTGLLCAVLTLTRPVGEWLFLVPLAVSLVVAATWRRRAAIAAAMIATFVVVMLPWAAVNQRQFNFFGIALGSGFGLFIRVFDVDRLEPPTDTRLPEIAKMLDYGIATQYSPATFVRDELRRHHYSAMQSDALMARFATETIAAHPGTFAVNSFKQWWVQIGSPLQDEAICASAQGPYVCSRRTQGYAREPFLNRPRYEHEPLRPWVVAYVRHFQINMAMVVALATFALISCVAARTGDLARVLFLAGVIAYFTFLPALAQSPQDRYRLPIDGLLFMFAAHGAVQLIRLLGSTARTAADASVPAGESLY